MKLGTLLSTVIYSEVFSESFMSEILTYLDSERCYVDVLDGKNVNLDLQVTSFHHMMGVNKQLPKTGRKSVLFIRDFYSASPSTQSKLLEIINEGRKQDFYVFIQADVYMKVNKDLRQAFPESIYTWMGRLKSKELLASESAYLLRNNEYLIKSQGNKVFKMNLVANTSSVQFDAQRPACVCSSRDLFNFGCRCGCFKKTLKSI